MALILSFSSVNPSQLVLPAQDGVHGYWVNHWGKVATKRSVKWAAGGKS